VALLYAEPRQPIEDAEFLFPQPFVAEAVRVGGGLAPDFSELFIGASGAKIGRA
jgi:hypothetical protein